MPTPSTPPPLRDRSSLATWRLAARLARRETRRRPGRTVLAAVLIALPVIAMTLGSVLVRTESASSGWAASWDRRFPGADVAVESTSGTGAGAGDGDGVVLPAGTRTIDVFTLYSESTSVDLSMDRVYTEWTDVPLDDPMVAGSVELLSGRWPRDGELLLDPNVANAFGVEAGDRLELARPSGTWTVAGIGRSRDSYWTPIVVAPGFVLPS